MNFKTTPKFWQLQKQFDSLTKENLENLDDPRAIFGNLFSHTENSPHFRGFYSIYILLYQKWYQKEHKIHLTSRISNLPRE